MAGHLIPEKRMNVNGHLVTKHVKPPRSNSAGGVLPHPNRVDSYLQHKRLVGDAADHVAATLSNYEGSDAGVRIKTICTPVFDKLSDEILEKISSYGRDQQSEYDGVFVSGCVNLLASLNATEQQFRHYFQMCEKLEEEAHIDEPDDMVSLCLGLSFYDQYVMGQYDHVKKLSPDDRTDYYYAVLRTTISLQQVVSQRDREVERGDREFKDEWLVAPVNDIRILNGDVGFSPLIEDPELIDVVIENVDRLESIVDFIETRGETNTEAIRDYMKGNFGAVGEGFL